MLYQVRRTGVLVVQTREPQRRATVNTRKRRQVSPARDRRKDRAEPGRRRPTCERGYAVPPPGCVPADQHDFCIRVQLQHLGYEIGRRKIGGRDEASRGFAHQLQSLFLVAGLPGRVGLDPGRAVVYMSLTISLAVPMNDCVSD